MEMGSRIKELDSRLQNCEAEKTPAASISFYRDFMEQILDLGNDQSSLLLGGRFFGISSSLKLTGSPRTYGHYSLRDPDHWLRNAPGS